MLPVERTAFWTAACRADESLRSQPLVVDRFAATLCGEEGLRIGRELETQGGAHDGIVLRTRVIDDLLHAAVVEHGHRWVVSLGCGLDARPYRMLLGGEVRFHEADHPSLIAWKNERARDLPVPVGVEIERHAFDLGDLDALDGLLPKDDRPFVVILEGVVQYFEPAHAAQLLRRLSVRSGGRVIADFGGGRYARKRATRIPAVVAATGAPYRTLVDEPGRWLAELGFSVANDVSIVEWDAAQPSPRWHVSWWDRLCFPDVRNAVRVLDVVSGATPR